MEIILPIKLVSPNIQEHWTKKHKRSKQLKLLLYSVLNQHEKPSLPVSITLTRNSPRPYDQDNYIASCKNLRDHLSSWLIPGLTAGRADADPRLQWYYYQKKTSKDYSVFIKIEPTKKP